MEIKINESVEWVIEGTKKPDQLQKPKTPGPFIVRVIMYILFDVFLCIFSYFFWLLFYCPIDPTPKTKEHQKQNKKEEALPKSKNK